jgi:hypothetical protein
MLSDIRGVVRCISIPKHCVPSCNVCKSEFSGEEMKVKVAKRETLGQRFGSRKLIFCFIFRDVILLASLRLLQRFYATFYHSS